MELAMRWHRILRAAAFGGGLLLGVAAAIFIFSNVGPVDVHWKIPSNNGPVLDWTLSGVSVWLLAVVPLLVGGVVGYLYQTPARLHHFREHMRHQHRVHELEKELKEVRHSLDKMLMMPEDGTLAVPALMPARARHAEVKVAEVLIPEEPEVITVDEFPDPEQPTPAEPPVSAVAAPAKPRRRFFGGPKEQPAAVKLPDVPSTVAARPKPAAKATSNGGKHGAGASPRRTSRATKAGPG